MRDTVDFLNALPEQVEEETLLASFDVESLYSNIPHELGIEAIKYWLEKHPQEIPNRFSKDFILEGIELILKNNSFYFDGTYYRQVKGTAMGTKFAPTYATLTIAYLEIKLYEKVKTEFGQEFSDYFKIYWKRFLDDCFIPWTRSETELNKLHVMLNSLHPDIKFTKEYSSGEQAFLDVMVRNKNGHIETDIYYKETDSKQYLLFNSCHPRHTKTSIPFCLARRIKTIVSDDDMLAKRFDELEKFLIKQNYPHNIIKIGIQKAMALNRQTLRIIKDKVQQDIIPFVSTYNPKNPEVFNIINQNLPILYEDRHMKDLYSKYTFIKSKRQPKNLKKLLTKARFDSTTITPEVKKCNGKKCGLCIHLIEGNSFQFNCGAVFEIKQSMSCDVKNLIYVMKCAGCGLEYIGETSDLRKRVTVHNQQIRDPRIRVLKVSAHIDACANTCNPKYHILPFYKMNTQCTISRRNKEAYFIKQFKPVLNSKV